jgi:hypothetical protein
MPGKAIKSGMSGDLYDKKITVDIDAYDLLAKQAKAAGLKKETGIYRMTIVTPLIKE